MIQCEKCHANIGKCPVCDHQLSQSVKGGWYHHGNQEDNGGCPWHGTWLTDEQLEYLARTKVGFLAKHWTACQFCKYFVGQTDPEMNWKPCGFQTNPPGDNMVTRAILVSLSRMDRCPMFEKPVFINPKERKEGSK